MGDWKPGDVPGADESAKLIEQVLVCADDPMWADHAEVTKSFLRKVAEHFARVVKERDEFRLETGELVVAQYRISALEADLTAARSEIERRDEALTRIENEACRGLDQGDTREALLGVKFAARSLLHKEEGK